MLVNMQHSDSSLKTYWESLNSSTADTAKTPFVIRKQLLYRVRYDRDGKEVRQLVVPDVLRKFLDLHISQY